jgi:hypothetical protein
MDMISPWKASNGFIRTYLKIKNLIQVGWGERSEPQQIVGLRRFAPNPTYIKTIFETASSKGV